MSVGWNPWHGCRKISEGCRHCYVYRQDERHDKDSSEVRKTSAFNLPVRRSRDGRFKVPAGEMVYTCFTSDFLVEEADAWRAEAWEMIRTRSDLRFFFITKRIDRLMQVLPPDWGDGYENLIVGCTVENQAAADRRLPLLLEAPLRHKLIVCAPLLGPLDIAQYLTSEIEEVSAGGESGNDARPVRLRLGAFDPPAVSRCGHSLLLPPDGRTAYQKRPAVPHPPPVPARAGPQGGNRLQGKTIAAPVSRSGLLNTTACDAVRRCSRPAAKPAGIRARPTPCRAYKARTCCPRRPRMR